MDIIPSFLEVATIGQNSRFLDSFDNFSLRIGEVQDVVYPSDPNSFSKQVIEYGVYTQHFENNTTVTKMYHHCVLLNPLAGLADKFYFTLRKGDTSKTIREGSFTVGKGSKVLLLCINGDTNNAVILGGLRDEADLLDLVAEDLGHHLRFNFNGIDATINKDGELEIQYQGKTNDDGTTNKEVDSRAPGTTIVFKKDGTLSLHTGNGQSIVIDNESGNISIASNGVLTGGATDATMKGTTYRAAESSMHAQMQAGLAQLASSLVAAGFSLGNTSLGTAGAAALQIQAAISGFEGQSSGFLSTKNKSD